MTTRDNQQKFDQYIVFNKAKSGSVIFNFNVDGLASRFCRKHYVLYPHGIIKPNIVCSEKWDEIIEICLEYSIEPPMFPNLLYPQREPLGITNNIQYQHARILYPFTDCVVLIGYSFGFDGINMDDWDSFDYFINLFNIDKKTIIIIDPFRSEEIVAMLSEELKRNDIYGIPAFWNHLSSAILELERIRLLYPHIKENHKTNLEYIYKSILDKKA